MSVAPALVDDLRKELEPVALEPSALELLVALETGGAADAVSLTIPGWNWDQYVAVGRFLGEIKRRTSWYIGDLLISARDNFAEEFAQLEASTGLAPQTLLAYMFVCENVTPKRRKQGVPFSCHAAVARLTPAEQTKWLKLCESAGLTYAELRERMKASRKDTKPQIEGTESSDPDTELVIEVAEAILRDAVPATDGVSFVISRELMVRLRGAMGRE